MIITVSLGSLFGFAVLIWFFKAFLKICQPHEVMVFSGRGAKPRIVFEGRAFCLPLIEEVNVLDLRLMEVHISIKNAYAQGGIPIDAVAVANIKVTDNRDLILNAVERYLGHGRNFIKASAKETLEGHLRGVIATMTPEALNEDRLALLKSIKQECEEDLQQMGLHLDTFNIHQISDEAGYLESIGREQIANLKRRVEVAKSDAERAAAEEEALWRGRASVAKEGAGAVIAEKKNELRKMQADLEARAKSEEVTAEANARAARARAERELQLVRTELEKLRLQADVVEPAEAERQARVFAARGAAAPLAERSRALAESLGYVAEVWQQAGDEARTIFLVQRIETILQQIISQIDVGVDEVCLVDDGSGQALPKYLESQLSGITTVLEQLQVITGLDVKAALGGQGPALSGKGGAA